MSKEKLSAEEISEVKKRLQEGANFPTETMEGLMIIDRKKSNYLLSLIEQSEQLQRDKISAFTLLRDGVEAFTSGDSNNRMTWISQASIFLTPKPEK